MKKLLSILFLIALSTAFATAANASHTPSAWERQIVASCLILEASDQDEQGMRAVASVIRNRADNKGSKILRVVKQPYAFTSLNAASTGKTGGRGYANHVQRASRDANWKLALQIVDDMYSNNWYDTTYGADHYVHRDIRPSWTRRMSVTAVIGAHTFYSSEG